MGIDHGRGHIGVAEQPLGGPEAVLDYLGRYTHRVAISNERIVGIDESEVSFRVRADRSSGKKRTIHLPGTEFIGRFLHHVLPPVSSGSGTMVCCRLPERRAGWPLPVPRSMCRHHNPKSSSRWPSSCAGWRASNRRAVRIAVSDSFACRRCSCVSLADRPTFLRPGGHRERGRRRTPQRLSKRWKDRFRCCLRVRALSSSMR